MFEALFILTTIDTGTRVARFVLQEMLARSGRAPAPQERRRGLAALGDPASRVGAVVTTAIVVIAWAWLISSGSIATIWPMFGIANQLLAAVALVVGTTLILKEAQRKRYALVTGLPLLFVGTTTIVAGIRALIEIYVPMSQVPQTHTIGTVCTVVTIVLLLGVGVILAAAGSRWARLLQERSTSTASSSARA